MGREIERIVEACKNANTPEPEFKYDGGGLWTTFYFSKEYKEEIFGTNQKPTRNYPRNIVKKN